MMILLIDDDPLVLRSIKRLLIQKNHILTSCSNGDEAINELEDYNRFDAVICDFDMPTPGWKVWQVYNDMYPHEMFRFAFHSSEPISDLEKYDVEVLPKSINSIFLIEQFLIKIKENEF